jgi:hypothetical protein
MASALLTRPSGWAAPLVRSARRYILVAVFIEVVVTAALSLFPLLAIGFVAFVKSGDTANPLDVILSPLSSGQLFLYCFSTLAVVLWIVFSDTGKMSRITIGPVTLLLILYTTLIIGVDPQITNLTNRTLITTSYYVYVISVVLHYIVLSIKNAKPPSVEETLETAVDQLASGVDQLEQRLHGASDAQHA